MFIARVTTAGSLVRAAGAALLVLFAAATVYADPYPHIKDLDNADVMFVQLEQAISDYYVDAENAMPAPHLSFYSYDAAKGETLFDLASRANLPYDTIATLNRLSGPETFATGTHLLLSSVPGIFVP